MHLKLKPNEKHRVRCKCKGKKCKWKLFASIDRDTGDFMVKKYHPFHRCPTYNKNKLCTSKYIANKYKDRIIFQSYIRIWEIQEMVRDGLGLRLTLKSILNVTLWKIICVKPLTHGY